MTTSPATRYSLLIRIQDAQNHAAWMEFVDLYEPLVYRLARRKGLQEADARDLCQDVFRAVAGAVRRWTPDPKLGSFRGKAVSDRQELCRELPAPCEPARASQWPFGRSADAGASAGDG